jgi:hypothetical protein
MESKILKRCGLPFPWLKIPYYNDKKIKIEIGEKSLILLSHFLNKIKEMVRNFRKGKEKMNHEKIMCLFFFWSMGFFPMLSSQKTSYHEKKS